MNNDTITIDLDRTRTLKFRRKELKMLEKVINTTLAKIDFENMDVDTLTKMIHLGLIHEETKLKLETVEDMLDDSTLTFGEMIELTMEAFSIAMSGAKKEAPKSVDGQDGGSEEKN